jgi:hypothetical protein
MVVAQFRSTQVLEHKPKEDLGAIARMAAEKSRPDLEDIGIPPRQQAAIVDAIRLVLMNDVDQAERALERGEFSQDDIKQVLPLLVSGLQHQGA